jgi:parvulin-like peptidyl-prolyl isomerase
VIVMATQREAGELREALEGATGDRSLRFADAAARSSIDSSAARGGLLDPISPLDPTYPAAVGRAFEELGPGEISPVLAVDRGFALVLLEERLPGRDVPRETVEEQLRAEVRLRLERLAMDDLAARLLRGASITVFDRGLERAWRARPSATERP